MTNQRKRIRRTLVDILMELIGLAVLAIFMWNLQTGAVIRRQESNSLTKLTIARQRMEQHEAEARDNLRAYDAFNQAKADAIAYCLDLHPDAKDLNQLCRQWDLPVYYRLNQAGEATESSLPPAKRDLLPFLDSITTLAPVTLEDGYRFYLSPLEDGGVFIGGRSMDVEAAQLKQLRSLSESLGSLKVGITGYVFAIDPELGTVAYHPNRSLIGASAAQIGYDPDRYPDSFNGWATLRGTPCYCVSQAAGDTLLVAVVPKEELMSDAERVTGLSVMVFAIVVSLLVIYALILRRDQDRRPPRQEDYMKVGALYLDLSVASKLRNMALLGLAAVFLVTFYVQTLSALSRQSMISETKLESVEQLLDHNEQRIQALTREYNVEYARRAKDVAWTLAWDPALVDGDRLMELAQKTQVSSIYVFNKNGRTTATSTNYKDFVLSGDPDDQSYPFWTVVKGYSDELVQDAREDDASHSLIQYVGVRRLDAPGMVQLGVSPRRMASRLKTTDLNYVLSGVAVENDGLLFTVDPAAHLILTYPNSRYIGRDAYSYGMTETMLTDGYTGIHTIDGTDYFVTGRLRDDDLLMIAVPLKTIYAQRLGASLWVTVISLVIILLISCFLLFGGKPSEDVPRDTAGLDSLSSSRFYRIFQDNGRPRVIQTAASRWSGIRQPWSEKTPEQKLTRIVGYVTGAGIVVLVCWMWMFHAALDKGSIISYIFSEKWEKSVNLFSLTYAGFKALETFVITILIRRIITFTFSRLGARSETIGRLLDSFIKYAAIIGVIFFFLKAIGVDSTAIITSAGILSLVIGLGAQSLIGDILAGIFIVFEGEFRVGDIVTIGDWRGTVLEIGIRTTKIEDVGNNIKIFNNSAISGVINMTKQYSYAYADVSIEYGESLERVESVLKAELPPMKGRLPAIMAGPLYAGVISLGESGVNLRIIAQCEEKNRVQLSRDLNRELKLVFDKHGVNIPFPQVVVNQPAVHEKPTRNEIKAAHAFVREQKELTRDIHVRDED